MLYCPNCDKLGDFNSVARTFPNTSIINVCKKCGNQQLSSSKTAHHNKQKSVSSQETIFIWLAVVVGIIFGAMMASSAMAGGEYNQLAEIGVVGSFIFGFILGFMIVCIPYFIVKNI
jgi:hypothetical protein